MSEPASTTGASAATTDAGSTASESTADAPGTQVPAGYVPQAELDKAQATARGLQSEKDKLAARVAELEKPKPTESTTSPNGEADTASLIAAMERRVELREARAEFRSDDRFKEADPELFARATEFDSAEAFEAALLESAESRKTARQAMREEVLSEVVTDLKEKYPDLANVLGGGSGTPPSGDGGSSTADGPMTAARLASMTQAEFESWTAANPAEYERLMSGSV